jgi:hypothetical protein
MQQAQPTSRSIVFRNYARLKALARANPVLIDLTYLNNALGEAQKTLRKEGITGYFTTPDWCKCDDNSTRTRPNRRTADGKSHYSGPCKHRLAEMLKNPSLDPDRVLQSILQEATSKCSKTWRNRTFRRGMSR